MNRCIMIFTLAIVGTTASIASTVFEAAVTNALTNKSCLVDDRFTNYIHQCASQSTNAEMALTANVVLGISRLEMFDQTPDAPILDMAFQSVSNALSSAVLVPDRWQYWHMQILHVSCMNTANDVQGAYRIASNAWDIVQSSGFQGSTNVVSQALMRYYGIGGDVSIKAAIALYKALSAAAVGKHEETHALKSYLPERLKQRMERFLDD